MKIFFISLLVLVTAIEHASALDVIRYERSSGSEILKLADSEVEKIWASNDPACIKKKNQLIGYNKAFASKRLKYGDCSSSPAAKEDARLLGYQVHVIKFNQLSESMAKQVIQNQ
jgi:hypothetical protein